MDHDQENQSYISPYSLRSPSFWRKVLGFGVGCGFIVLAWFFWSAITETQKNHLSQTLSIADRTWYVVGVAKTDESRAQGLAGRSQLAHQTGLLFLFDTPGTYGFWMKGMHFPIDIIFLRDGRVDSVARNRQPGDLTPVLPRKPVNQVFEVNAGEADGIVEGDLATSMLLPKE